MTAYDKAEARLQVNQYSLSTIVSPECGPLVQQAIDELYDMARSAHSHDDLFSGSNDPDFGAQILVRQCNELLEVTPVYERELPSQPPFSPSELLVGRLLVGRFNTQNQEAIHG